MALVYTACRHDIDQPRCLNFLQTGDVRAGADCRIRAHQSDVSIPVDRIVGIVLRRFSFALTCAWQNKHQSACDVSDRVGASRLIPAQGVS